MPREIILKEVTSGSFIALRTALGLSRWRLFTSGITEQPSVTRALEVLMDTCAPCPIRNRCNPIIDYTETSISQHGLNTGSPSCAIPKTGDGSLRISL